MFLVCTGTFQLKDTSRYYASLWEREEVNILHSKVAVTVECNEWMRVSVAVSCCHISPFGNRHSLIQILKSHWTWWKKRFTESFEMKEGHIESCLKEDSGRGWHASCVGKNWVSDSPLLSYCMCLIVLVLL